MTDEDHSPSKRAEAARTAIVESIRASHDYLVPGVWDVCDAIDELIQARIEQIAGAALCGGCNKRIDPEVCGCGEYIKGHGYESGHAPVPMGCDCMRDPSPTPPSP